MTAFALDNRTLWYLTRGTGMVTLILLTVTLLLGIASIAPETRSLPRYVVAGLHRNLSLLVVVFVSVHVLTAVIDPYAGIRLVNAVVPLTSAYRPLWLGLGALALDLVLAVVATSLLRVPLGERAWRAVHWSVYAIWPIAAVHALGSGSDLRSGLLTVVVAVSTSAVLAGLAWRLLSSPARASTKAICAGGALLVVLLVAAWALQGPLAPGWSQRAAAVAGATA